MTVDHSEITCYAPSGSDNVDTVVTVDSISSSGGFISYSNTYHDMENGHSYCFLNISKTWEEAANYAQNIVYQGLPGYLATITSQREYDMLVSQFGSSVGSVSGIVRNGL